MLSFKSSATEERRVISHINSSKLKCGQKELDYLFEIDSYIEGKDDIGAQIRKLVLFKENLKRIISSQNFLKAVVYKDSSLPYLKVAEYVLRQSGLDWKYVNSPQLDKYNYITNRISKIHFISKWLNLFSILLFVKCYFKERMRIKAEISKHDNLYLIPAIADNFVHYRNRKPLLDEINKLPNSSAIIIHTNMRLKLENFGVLSEKVFFVLGLLSIVDVLKAIFIWHKHKPTLKPISRSAHEEFEEVIVRVLSQDIKRHLTYTSLKRALLHIATAKLFYGEKVVAVRLINTFNTFVGKLFYRAARLGLAKTITFKNDTMFKWGYYTPGDYDDFYHFQFVNGKSDFSWYRKHLHPDCRILIAGSQFADEATKAVHLEKQSNELRTVLYATSGLVPGFCTREETYKNVQSIFRLASAFSNVRFLIKPHPVEDEAILKRIKKWAEPLQNVELQSKNSDPKKYIKGCDVVICKTSGIALEAAFLGKPVISLITDSDKGFEGILQRLAEEITNLKEFERLMNLLLTGNFQSWQEKRLTIQKAFLEEQFPQPAISPASFVARTLVEHIKSMPTK